MYFFDKAARLLLLSVHSEFCCFKVCRFLFNENFSPFFPFSPAPTAKVSVHFAVHFDGLLLAFSHLSYSSRAFPFPLSVVSVWNECPRNVCSVVDRPCEQLDAVVQFDINVLSSKYMAPLQYITWRKMFKSLKPGNTRLSCASLDIKKLQFNCGSATVL